MKQCFGKLVALALFAVALTGAALAQESHMVRANIPFSFYAGGRLLPAGEYTVSVDLDNQSVHLTQQATGSGVLLLAGSDDASRDDRSVLIFTPVDGGAYMLRELKEPGLGVSFSAKGPHSTMRVQNQAGKSVTIVAEAK